MELINYEQVEGGDRFMQFAKDPRPVWAINVRLDRAPAK